MERERLARLLDEPGRMAREDLADLKALSSKYPWFSGAQLLRSAGERLSGDVLFDETLRTSSAHLPSRAVLFDLTAAPEQRTVKLQLVKPSPVAEAVRVLDAVPGPEEFLKGPPATVPTEVQEPPILVDPLASIPAAPAVVKPEAAEPLTEELSVALPPKDRPNVALGSDLDDQIIQAALVSAYDLTLLEGLEDAASTQPRTQPPVTSIQKPPSERRDPARSFIPKTARFRFTEWLDAVEVTEEPRPGVKPPPVETHALETCTEDKEAPNPLLPADSAALIDRFIQQANPEPQARNTFFTPQQAGKRSLDDTAGLVTETLARIYERQGNLPKAIETYRRLALKYPEKGAYFAALQKALEEQSNK